MSDQLVICNRGSGKSDQLQTLRERFDRVPTTWLELGQDCDLVSKIKTAVENGCSLIVAAGGDGTVNSVVNAMMSLAPEQRPCLAIVPLGTANDFAGTLNIPNDIQAAIQLIEIDRSTQQSRQSIDLVRISGLDFQRYYANVAAGGNSVRVTEEITDEVKSTWGALCYVRGAASVLPNMQTYIIDAECDGERFSDFASWAVLVANGRTNAGGINVAPQASPCDGLIDVILIRDGNALDMVEITASNLLGNYLECEQVVFRQVKKVVLHSKPSMRFTLDGEIVDEEPVEFEVVPGAIEMIVGEGLGGGRGNVRIP